MELWMYVLLGAIIAIILYVIIVFNKLIHLKNDVEEGFSTIDVYLKKRWDLIPSLVGVVKEYSKHEKETFKEIVDLRNKVYDEMNINSKVITNNDLSRELTKLLALAEDYPELKANENYLDLSKKLVKIEDEIAQSRKYYNAVVRVYNNKVQMFPSNIVALIFGYKKIAMFETNSLEKENINIDL